MLPSGIRRWPNKSVENFHRTRRRIRTQCVAPTNEVSRVASGTRVCQPFIEFTRLRRSYEQFFRLAAGRRPLRHAIPKRHPPSRGLRLSRLSRGELAALLAVPLVEEELGIHALGRPLRVLLGLLDTCSKEEGGTRRVSKRNLRFRPARRKEKTLATARTDDARTRRTRACSRHIAGGDAADAWPRAIGSCHRGERAHRRTCEPREVGGAMPNDGISPAPSRCIWDPDETPSARRGRRHHSPFLWFL